MAEIINLRKVRKSRARDEDDKRAAENRIAFGRTKTEKALSRAEKDLKQRRLEGLKLDPATALEKPE